MLEDGFCDPRKTVVANLLIVYVWAGGGGGGGRDKSHNLAAMAG